MSKQKRRAPTAPSRDSGRPADTSFDRLGGVFVYGALSGEDFLEEDHERALSEEPIVEPSYPSSWSWAGRPGDHRP